MIGVRSPKYVVVSSFFISSNFGFIIVIHCLNEKRKKNYLGFLIPNSWQSFRIFARQFHKPCISKEGEAFNEGFIKVNLLQNQKRI